MTDIVLEAADELPERRTRRTEMEKPQNEKIDGAIASYAMDAAEHHTHVTHAIVEINWRLHRGDLYCASLHIIEARKHCRALDHALKMLNFSLAENDAAGIEVHKAAAVIQLHQEKKE